MSGPEDDIAQAEKRRIIREQQQGGTFFQHGLAQADELSQGRFAATGAPRVVGSTPNPAAQYPAASSAHQTELPPEQPLGYSVDDMPGLEPSTAFPVVEQTDAPAGATAAAERLPPGSAQPDDAGASSFPTEASK
jgi:hypothetical protein